MYIGCHVCRCKLVSSLMSVYRTSLKFKMDSFLEFNLTFFSDSCCPALFETSLGLPHLGGEYVRAYCIYFL